MRRWNGWGEEGVHSSLSANAEKLLNFKIGPGTHPKDIAFEQAVAAVKPSRIPSHRLISTDLAERVKHARGQSLPDWIALRSGKIGYLPDGVAFPENTKEVRELLDYAVKHKVNLIPYGGGTSVVGHINIDDDSPVLTVDMCRMCRLLELDDVSHIARFEAGIRGPELEAALRARSFTLGHYPQSFEYSSLGGWICTRSSGQQSLGYGRIERLFAGGRMETLQGTLEMPVVPASAAGPDLKEMVLGSEGRYGILTEASVRVRRVPEHEEFHACFFPDFDSGIDAVKALVRQRLPLVLLRLSTSEETIITLAMAGKEKLISLLEKYLALRGAGAQKIFLVYGFAGSRQEVHFASRRVKTVNQRFGGVYAGQTFGKEWHKSRFKSPYLRNTLWEAGYAVDTFETAIPWVKVNGLISELHEKIESGLAYCNEKVQIHTHLSHFYTDGCSIYSTYLYRLADDPEESLARWRTLKEIASKTIVVCGGTISHQHGVGKDHLPYLQAEKGDLGMLLLQEAGAFLDRQQLLNPGKLF